MADAIDMQSLEDAITGADEDIDFTEPEDEEPGEEEVATEEEPEVDLAEAEAEGEEEEAEEAAPPKSELESFFDEELGVPKPEGAEEQPAAQPDMASQYVAGLQQQLQHAQTESSQLRQQMAQMSQNMNQAFRDMNRRMEAMRANPRQPPPRYEPGSEEDDYARLYNQIENGVQSQVKKQYDPVVQRLEGQLKRMQQDQQAREREAEVNRLAHQYTQMSEQAVMGVMGDKATEQFSGRWIENMRKAVLGAVYEAGQKPTAENLKAAAQAIHRERLEYFRDYHKEVMGAKAKAKATTKPPKAPAKSGVVAKKRAPTYDQATLEAHGFEDHWDWTDRGSPVLPTRKRKR